MCAHWGGELQSLCRQSASTDDKLRKGVLWRWGRKYVGPINSIQYKKGKECCYMHTSLDHTV